MTPRPRLYFSFRSPYSWLTIRRLRAAAPDAFTALDWLPYWDPDEETARLLEEQGAQLPYVPMSRAKHLYILMDTKRLAQAQGATMAWPVDSQPWWEPAHLAWLWACRLGRAERFYDEIAAARWGRGENICAPEVVGACARRSGLDPDAAARCTDDAELRREGVECLTRAYLDDVFGVPYLRWRHHRFWGYDRLDAFLATWPRDGRAGPVTTVVTAEVGADPLVAPDTDAPGGCG